METGHRRVHGGRIAAVRVLVLLCAALLLPLACEKFDVAPESPTDSPQSVVRPTALGEGTQLSPYTVGQVMAGDIADAGYHWFIGYAVGSTYRSMSNATFSASTTYTSNILLSSDSACTSPDGCIPVELASKTIQQAVSLAYDSLRHRQCLMVQATAGRYFSCNGLRSVQSACWFPGLDLSTIDSSPEEWEERTVEY